MHDSHEGPPSPNRFAHARSAPVDWPHFVDTQSLSESVGSSHRPAYFDHASQGWPPPGLPDPFLPMLAGTPQPLFQVGTGSTGNPFDSMFSESAPRGSSQADAMAADPPDEGSLGSQQPSKGPG